MAKLLDGTRIYGSANIDNSLIVNTMNIVPTITSSFLQANNANIYAFGAHQTANSAQIHANAAFLQANQVGGAVSTVNGALTAANTNMIFKTGNTMTGNLVMSGANIAFSTNSNSGIYWGGSGLSFIHSPNSNVIVFGTGNDEDMRLDPSGVLTVYSGITVAGTNIAPTLAFAYTHANGAFNQANNANIYAFGAHRTANSAQVHANAAFLQANNANIYAFGAHQTANSAHVHANAAFLQANQVGGAVSTTNGALTAANTNMVFKTGNTMTGNLVMSGANIAFVTNSNSGVYWGGSGLSFIHSPNSNVIVFGTSNGEDMRLDPNGILTVYSGITVAGTNIAPTLTFAYTHANGAFNQANNANIYAFGAHQTANSAHVHANAAFLQANNANIYAFGAHQTANSAQVHANAAFVKANAAFPSTGGSITGDVSISGNLIVIGNSTVFNVSSLIINDPLIFLGNNNYTSDLVDIGFVGHYNDGINAHTGFIRDSSNKEYFVFNGYTPEVLANDNINIAHPSFALANVNANYYKGNLISNTVVITISATIAGVNIVPTLSSSFIHANAAFDQANVARVHANGAFLQANNANIYAFGAHQTANSAQIHANAAFLQANNANIYAFGAHQTANSAHVHANAAFLQANQVGGAVSTANGALTAANTNMVFKTGNTMTGNLVMSGANIAFVTNSNSGVYWGGSGLSFIHSPNSNVIVFGTSNDEDMRLDPSGVLTVYTGITVAGTNIAPTLAFAYTHANGAFDQANTARVHANAAFTKANLAAPIASPTFTGTVTSPSPLILLKVSDPSEGGEIVFEKTSSSNLSGNLTLDLFGNLVRIFEQTGSNRGFFLDITKGNTGVAGEILHTNNWFNFISTSGGGTSSNSVVYYSDSPPTGVANGTLWWQSNTGGLFIRYGDGDSTQWVATQQQGVGGSATFAQPANNSIVQNTTQLLATANGLSYTSSTFASAGDASVKSYMLIGTTTNATPTRLLHSGGSGLIPVRSNTTIQYTVDIVARRTDVVDESAGWTLKGVLDNFSGTVADVGNLYEIIVARDDTNYAVDALANNTSKSLDVMVTGVAAKQIRWVAYVQTIEVSQ